MFPLYEPKLKSGKVVRWMDYFALRANPATHNQALNPGLELVGMSANAPDPQSPTGFAGDIPGFFLAGRKALPVPVLRPTVRPTY